MGFEMPMSYMAEIEKTRQAKADKQDGLGITEMYLVGV